MSSSEVNTEAPLVSYLVLAYNNAGFIREALDSAFAQTYHPLEIIIADDHSTDDTAREIAAALDAYTGPHEVRATRNAFNEGIGRNISRAMRECRGELIVVAAGDDRSDPRRTSVLVDAWLSTGRVATSIFSSYILMSETGEIAGVGGRRPCSGEPAAFLEGDLLTFARHRTPVVNGCTHAWSPRLFDHFGPLSSDLEDLVLSYRTLGIGRMLYVDEPLVYYRRHACNASFLAEGDDTRSFEHRERLLRAVDQKSMAAFDNLLADTEVLLQGAIISEADARSIRGVLRRVRRRYELEYRMLTSSFARRLRIWLASLADADPYASARALPRTLPRAAYRRLYELRQRVRGRRWATDVAER